MISAETVFNFHAFAYAAACSKAMPWPPNSDHARTLIIAKPVSIISQYSTGANTYQYVLIRVIRKLWGWAGEGILDPRHVESDV